MKETYKMKWILIIILISSGGAGIWFYSQRPKHFQDARLEQIFQMRDLYNNPMKPIDTDFIIINFWATWCPPCVEETPSLIRFTEKNKKYFTLLAYSQDSTKQEIESFIKTFPSLKSKSATIIHDDSQNLARAFFVNKLPETFIYSVKQNKYMQLSGSTDWDRPEVAAAIKKYFQVNLD